MANLVRGSALVFFATVCFAQPSIQSVTDSAGYGPRVAPGSLAAIFGTNLASSTASASSFPLPTSLGGSNVTISGTQVPLTYASATQINFQVPSSLAAGTASLIVHAPGGATSAFSFTVATAAPAIFQYGTNRAVAQNSDADHTLNGPDHPAAPGSVLTVYLTGQGPLDNAVADGQAAGSDPLSKATKTGTATIGSQNAAVQFLGMTPGYAGLAQANLTIPNLPAGDYPLVITIGGYVSASVLVSLSGSTSFTNPLALLGNAAFANSASSSVVLLGNTAYVCGTQRIVMVDVSNPAQPAVVGNFGSSTLNGNGTICAINTSTGSPYLVDVVGPLASPVSFATFDLSNPRSPVLVGLTKTQYPYVVSLSFYLTVGYATTSYFSFNLGNKAIVSQTGDYLAFDFSAPGSPQLIGVLSPGSLSNQNLKPASAVLNQAYAYVGTSTATGSSTKGTGVLAAVNIASPTSMFLTNSVGVSPAAIVHSFDVSGNTLLAAGNTTGNRNPGNPDFSFTGNLTLATVDVTNSAAPNVLASFDTGIQTNGAFATAAFGSPVFAVVGNAPATDVGGPALLLLVDARKPQSPVAYPIASQFGLSDVLATSLGYLLAPNSLGLSVYQLQLQ